MPKKNNGEREGFMMMPLRVWNSELSRDAACLYMFLLNRCCLSEKNGLRDERGVYVFCTHETAARELRCSRRTALKLFTELEESGFLSKYSRGLGKANQYYLSYAGPPAKREEKTSVPEKQREQGRFSQKERRSGKQETYASTFDLSDLEALISRQNFGGAV